MLLNLLFITSFCKNKAVLIAGSGGWNNYRFESDIWSIYQKLLERGLDSKDIIIACYDDIVNNPNNTYKGQLFNDLEHHQNVYGGKNKLNYKNKITAKTIVEIFNNLDSTENDNLFIYYESHGLQGYLLVPNQEEGLLSADTMAQLLILLSINKKFKNCLFLIEACYSGFIGSYYEQMSSLYSVNNIVIITSATETQTSVSSKFDYWLSNYLSTQFSSNFQDKIQNDQECTVNELFDYLSSNSKGSNPTIFGSQDIKSMKISDFIGKKALIDNASIKENVQLKQTSITKNLNINPNDMIFHLKNIEKSKLDLLLEKIKQKLNQIKQNKKDDFIAKKDYLEIVRHIYTKFGTVSEYDYNKFVKINEISKFVPKEKIIEIIDNLK